MAEEDKDKDKDKDKDEAAAEGAEGEGAGGEAPKKVPLWKNKKFIIIGVAVLVLLGGGCFAGLYFTGKIGGKKAEESAAGDKHAGKEEKEDKDRKLVFYDLGDLIVNLSGDGKRVNFLKLKLSLELDDDHDKAKIDQIKPRILDDFQTYLRELRIDDLKGSAGMYRLREELLLRVSEAAHPSRIRDVLITEMLVQ